MSGAPGSFGSRLDSILVAFWTAIGQGACGGLGHVGFPLGGVLVASWIVSEVSWCFVTVLEAWLERLDGMLTVK